MDAKKRRAELFVFSGGVLETVDYGGGDSGGVYLEFMSRVLPQRVPGGLGVPSPVHPVESADAETCGRVLRSLRRWEA